jgi:hypothetical protein
MSQAWATYQKPVSGEKKTEKRCKSTCKEFLILIKT